MQNKQREEVFACPAVILIEIFPKRKKNPFTLFEMQKNILMLWQI